MLLIIKQKKQVS